VLEATLWNMMQTLALYFRNCSILEISLDGS